MVQYMLYLCRADVQPSCWSAVTSVHTSRYALCACSEGCAAVAPTIMCSTPAAHSSTAGIAISAHRLVNL